MGVQIMLECRMPGYFFPIGLNLLLSYVSVYLYYVSRACYLVLCIFTVLWQPEGADNVSSIRDSGCLAVFGNSPITSR
jgi:hypothetical protein